MHEHLRGGARRRVGHRRCLSPCHGARMAATCASLIHEARFDYIHGRGDGRRRQTCPEACAQVGHGPVCEESPRYQLSFDLVIGAKLRSTHQEGAREVGANACAAQQLSGVHIRAVVRRTTWHDKAGGGHAPAQKPRIPSVRRTRLATSAADVCASPLAWSFTLITSMGFSIEMPMPPAVPPAKSRFAYPTSRPADGCRSYEFTIRSVSGHPVAGSSARPQALQELQTRQLRNRLQRKHLAKSC
jgi:hypothetical protein